ncbi:MAG: hypothetical protein K0R38_5580 [Polyangiaceae bacterium]|jgi:hypothetical protein|nr:hypothetical protein [Polyangiaceae bacterium]
MRLRLAAVAALSYSLTTGCVEQPDGSWEFDGSQVKALDAQGFFPGRGYFLNADSVASDCLVPAGYTSGGVLTIEPRRAAFTGGQEVSFALSKVESSQEIQDRLSITASASAKFLVAGGDAKFSFAEETKTSETSVILIASLLVRNTAWTVPAGVKLSDDAKALLQTANFARFRERCGDAFLQSYTTGGEFYAAIEITTSSKEEKQAISSSIKGNYFTVSGSAEFSKELQKIAQNSSTVVRSFQLGGKEIDTAPCRTVACVAERLVQFTTAVAKAPVVLSAQTAPYSVLAMPSDAVSPLDITVSLDTQRDINFQRNATRDSLTKFLEVQSHPERYLLKAPHATLAEVTSTISTLNGNLTQLDTALKACARDPNRCTMPSLSAISVLPPPPAPGVRGPSVLRSYAAPSDFLAGGQVNTSVCSVPSALPLTSDAASLPNLAFTFRPGQAPSLIPGVDTVSLQPVTESSAYLAVGSKCGSGVATYISAPTTARYRENSTFYLEPGLNGKANTYSLRLYWTNDPYICPNGPESCLKDGRNRTESYYLVRTEAVRIRAEHVPTTADAALKDRASWYLELP